MKNKLKLIACGALMFTAASVAHADVFVLDFEGVGNEVAIDGFYNGGTDGAGNMGTNYGVEFSPNTLGIIDQDAGGSGNFANEPSPDTIMFWLDNSSAIMNVAAGFQDGFSFFYTSSTVATITVYSGLGGTGDILGTLDLVAQFNDDCVGDPSGSFCNWTAIGVEFEGTAMSIDFGGTANQTGYDDVTFGSATPGGPEVPEPTSLALLGLGLVGMGLRRRMAKR